MRVLVLGREIADVALLVAERVGPNGGVVAMHGDAKTVGEARRRAIVECLDQVSFQTGSLRRAGVKAPFDAVFGRFFLMYQPDPVQAIRRAASMVHEGGRIVFQEWHYDSIRWGPTPAQPPVPLYREYVRLSIEALRRRRAHTDMGLRLVDAFTEAGLAVPSIRTDLRVVHGAGSLGYTFFENEMRDFDLKAGTFAERLERETTGAGGHLLLPLQVGAWTVGLGAW
jgi:SAM-dependent methyltransferase